MDNVQLYEPLPDDVVQAMREEYAPPAGASYWASLETRIMASVKAEEALRRNRHWWQAGPRWSRIGIAAAAAVLLLVGALLMRSHTQDMRTAEGAKAPPPAESLTVPQGALSEREGSEARDATFKDVISHPAK